MAPPPVLTKQDMYRRRDRGEFGNTLRRFLSVAEWESAPDGAMSGIPLWGVQHTTKAAFPGTRLNVPTADVSRIVRQNNFGSDYCISRMVDSAVAILWEGDVGRRHDGPGLLCSGNTYPLCGNGRWRQHMLNPRRWEGSAATVLLTHLLNDNSRDDLEILLDAFPDHVIELSVFDRCFGTVKGRNALVWEVRRY